MNFVVVENTDKYLVKSFGNGFAYEFKNKQTNQSGFVQGEDALQWAEDYHSMDSAHANPDSVWYDKSWNYCLSELIEDYLGD